LHAHKPDHPFWVNRLQPELHAAAGLEEQLQRELHLARRVNARELRDLAEVRPVSESQPQSELHLAIRRRRVRNSSGLRRADRRVGPAEMN
jgi:hypothetical protein